MLILTRKKGTKIIINDDITIKVLDFNHNQVRLGIEAPESVMVNREEVWLRIKNGEKKNDNNI